MMDANRFVQIVANFVNNDNIHEIINDSSFFFSHLSLFGVMGRVYNDGAVAIELVLL